MHWRLLSKNGLASTLPFDSFYYLHNRQPNRWELFDDHAIYVDPKDNVLCIYFKGWDLQRYRRYYHECENKAYSIPERIKAAHERYRTHRQEEYERRIENKRLVREETLKRIESQLAGAQSLREFLDGEISSSEQTILRSVSVCADVSSSLQNATANNAPPHEKASTTKIKYPTIKVYGKKEKQ